MTKRYIVMSAPKRKEQPEYFAPLSFGRADELASDQLLRRGRATLFATEHQARNALEHTLRSATANGDSWPTNYVYVFIEVADAAERHE